MTARVALIAPLLFALPAQAQPAQWAFAADKIEASLQAPPSPMAQPLAAHCTRKTGQVLFRMPAGARLAETRPATVDRYGRAVPWRVSVTVRSATLATTVPGEIRAAGPLGDLELAVELSTRAPVLTEFGRTGTLALEAAGEVFAPAPAPPRTVRRFLGACR